jgi:outer membrane protein assembly factor BamB
MRSASRSRLGLLLVLLLVFASGIGLSTSLRGVAHASGPQLLLSKKVGPPTTIVQAQGYGFGVSETVTIDFDRAQVGIATADNTGKFVLRITVPRNALPGMHTVQATGQTSSLKAQALFLVRTDWSQLQFGSRHMSDNPYENVLSSSNVSRLTLDWSYTATGGYGGSSSSAAVVNGIVYIESDKLYALDAVTGALKWSYSTGDSIATSPAVANGVIYMYSSNDCSNLVALDAITGTLKWSSSVGSIQSADCPFPSVSNGIVYVVTDKLYALDTVTGALKWSFNVMGDSLAIAHDIVYFGAYDDNLYALDMLTGALKWKYFTVGTYANSLAIANGVVYLSSGNMYALDAVTGALKWSYSTGNRYLCAPTAVNGMLYFGSLNIYAFHLPGMS